MIDRIIHFSIRNKLVVGFFIALWVAWGLYSAKHVAIDAVPDITTNQVQVITRAPMLATQEVEQYITFPIEIALANLPGIVEIRSISRYGLSVVTVVFEDDMDIYLARQLISEQLKIAEEQIPKEFGTPELGPITTGLGEIYQYVLYPKEGYEDRYSIMDLRTINDWLVRRQLAGIPGVIEINTWGGYLKQYEVAIDPEKLRSLDVTLSEVFEALEKNNSNTGAAYIEKNYQMYLIRGEGVAKTLEDIENIVVKNVNGIPILIKDIAQVRFGYAPRYGAVTRNGEGEVVGGVVMMLKGENSAAVIQRVKERIEEVKASLPEGVVLEAFLDRSELVNRTIKTVITNLTEGGLIVIFVLVLILGNLRAGFIVASVIPLAMLFALGMMYSLGISANLMSLGAIDFGIIVDGSVIIVEATLYHLHRYFAGKVLSREKMDQEVFNAASRIRRSAAFGEIIILIVYFPIMALVGIEGKLFKPMAQTVSFALTGALILSLTYVPMMSAWLLSRRIPLHEKKPFSERLIEWLQRRYRPVLKAALRYRALTVALALGLFGGSLYIFSTMGGEFVPTLEEGDLALHQILPPGASLSHSIEVSLKLQKLLLENFPEIEQIVTKIGTAEIPTDPMPVETGDIMVNMKPKEEWRYPDREMMFRKMEEVMKAVPGVGFVFSQPIQMRFNELIAGVREDIAVKIFGEDVETLYRLAKEAERIIREIPGVGDVKVEQTTGLPQIVVRYDRAKLAQYGLDIATLNRYLRAAFAGEKVGVIFEQEKRFDLVVRFLPEYRKDIFYVKNLYIPLPNGNQVPLKEVAYIGYEMGPMQISREGTKRRIYIGVNARGRDTESLVEEIDKRLKESLDLPPGYYIRYGGQFEHLRAAKERLSIAVPVALGLIFLLLYLTFNSVKYALLIYTAIPLAAIGGILSLYLRGMPFSISAGVGFIALFGIATLNGIVLIAYFSALKQQGIQNVYRRVLAGTAVRFRPVLVTALVAALGFLPMAVSTQPGAEVQRPLATVVIGGLISSTLLTLVVLPVLYVWSETWKFSLKWKKGATILLLLLSFNAFAQTEKVLSLELLEKEVMENYPLLQQRYLEIERRSVLAKNFMELPDLQISYGKGQFNTEVYDYQWQITQSIDIPLRYVRQTRWKRQQVEVARWQYRSDVQWFVWKARDDYLEWRYREAQVRLLDSMATLLHELYQSVERRYDLGDATAAERLSAYNTYQQRLLALQQAKAQEAQAKNAVIQWLGDYQGELKAKEHYPWLLNLPLQDSAQIAMHPLLRQQQAQIASQNAFYQWQKTQWMPQISVSYFNQSNDGAPNFVGYYLGISFPLWWLNWKTQQQAAKVAVQQAKKAYEQQERQLKQMFNTYYARLKSYEIQLEYFHTQGLKAARELRYFALKGYKTGELNYEAMLIFLMQSLSMELQYLEVVHQYNLTVSALSFLLQPLTTKE